MLYLCILPTVLKRFFCSIDCLLIVFILFWFIILCGATKEHWLFNENSSQSLSNLSSFCSVNLRIQCAKNALGWHAKETMKNVNELDAAFFQYSHLMYQNHRLVDVVRQTLLLPLICCCCLVDVIRIKYICILMMKSSVTWMAKISLFGTTFLARAYF